MKAKHKWRSHLFAPLVYAAALILLLEDWFWDIGARLIGYITSWPPIRNLETHIKALPPWGAMLLFMLPAVLLFPVKILALMAIAHGHAFAGVLVILAAKVGGAAAVARLYALTKPKLMELAWFARWHDKFMDVKDRWIARLRATRAMRSIKALRLRIRGAVRAGVDGLRTLLRPRGPERKRHRTLRILRRLFVMMRRSRR
ncbi:MAG: hypothetical protein V4463_08855 [Pseudomonadota bacterium]